MIDDGREPLLTSEETDALLEAMRSSGGDAPNVEGADLGSPDRPLRVALGRADRCAQEFSPMVRKTVLHMSGCISAAEEQPAEIVPFNVLSNAILPGSSVSTIAINNEVQGLIVVAPSLCSFIIDRRLGAPVGDDKIQPTIRSELSSIDRRILTPFIDALCKDFSKVWNGSENVFQIEKILKGINELPAWTQFEPLLRTGVRVVPANYVGDEVVIALTAAAVRATSKQDLAVKTPPISMDDRARMIYGLSSSDVEMSAILGNATSSVGEILSLTRGDVIRLNTIPNQPIPLQIEGISKLKGLPIVHHGNLAIEVTNPLGDTEHGDR